MNQFQFDLMCGHHRIWLKDNSFAARADFTGRTLENLNAAGQDLTGAIFTNAKIFTCDFSNTNLTNIVAAGTHFLDTDFTSANFKNAYMPRAQYTQVTFQWTDLWNVAGDGTYIITLQLGGAHVCYTSKALQINCLRFDINKIWWMSTEEISSRIIEHTDEEKAKMLKWWADWKYQIYQIVNKNPAKPINATK